MYSGGGAEETKRERERERESKGQQMRDASIPHFFFEKKKNYALFFAKRGERGEKD